jgi:hypothetical protein
MHLIYFGEDSAILEGKDITKRAAIIRTENSRLLFPGINQSQIDHIDQGKDDAQ